MLQPMVWQPSTKHTVYGGQLPAPPTSIHAACNWLLQHSCSTILIIVNPIKVITKPVEPTPGEPV
jgi:hypothetical protein